MNAHFPVVENYLKLSQVLESEPRAYASVLHPQVEQTEYPNRFSPVVQHRLFDDIMANVRAGREMLESVEYSNVKLYAAADGSVAAEMEWSATPVTTVNGMTRGGQLKGRFCMVFEFQDGLIIRHRAHRHFEREAE